MNDVATRLVKRARAGEGPAFLQCDTYRYSGHHVGDINREYYRSKQEEQLWKTDRDPINLVLAQLVDRRRICRLSRSRSDHFGSPHRDGSGREFAIAAPYPNVDEVEKDVYA